MRDVVYLGGRFVDSPSEASVSLYDRGYLLGDAVFETVRTYGLRPFALPDHLLRLAHGAAVLGIAIPEAIDAITTRVYEAIDRLGAEAVVRVTLSRGDGPRGIGADGYEAPQLSIIAAPLIPYPAEAHAVGIDAAIVEQRRIPAVCLDPTIKHAHYLPQILARRSLHGLEGVMLGVDGQVVSGLVSNVMIGRAGELITPPLVSGCLPGITRDRVLKLARARGLAVREEALYPADLHQADELFFTSTLMGCLPARSLDGRAYDAAPGPLASLLGAALEHHARQGRD